MCVGRLGEEIQSCVEDVGSDNGWMGFMTRGCGESSPMPEAREEGEDSPDSGKFAALLRGRGSDRGGRREEVLLDHIFVSHHTDWVLDDHLLLIGRIIGPRVRKRCVEASDSSCFATDIPFGDDQE